MGPACRVLVAGQPGDAADDPGVAGQDLLGRQVAQAQRRRDDGHGERAGDGLPQLGRPVRADHGDQAGGFRLGERPEPGRGVPAVERAEERGPVPGVRRPVERQHARPDHPRGGEPRIVDGKGPRGTHHRDGRRVAGDEPPAERRHPRHRGALAQARQQRMRIPLQRAEGQRLPVRGAATTSRSIR